MLERIKNQRAGFSLGGVLAVMVLLAGLAAGLAKLSVSHIQVVSHSQNALEASNAARSVIAQAIAKILEDQSFGQDLSAQETIVYTNGESVGLLSFHPQTSSTHS